MPRLKPASVIAAAVAGMIGLTAPARADVQWVLSNVAFSDGAMLSGWFDTDSFGNLSTYDMDLTGSAVGSASFTPATSTGYVFGSNFFEVALPDASADIVHVQIQADVNFTGTGPITLNGGTNLYDGIGHYGAASGTVSAASVAEPGSLTLIGAGMVGMVGMALRRLRGRADGSAA